MPRWTAVTSPSALMKTVAGKVPGTPKLKEVVFGRLQNHFGVRLPEEPGLDTLGCIEAAANGRLRVGFCLGGNLYGSNPDSKFVAGALA